MIAIVSTFDSHLPSRLRPKIADAHGDGREAVERFAELIERERLDVIFEVRGGEFRSGLGEDAQLNSAP